jgi:hypothetical protein
LINYKRRELKNKGKRLRKKKKNMRREQDGKI